MSLEFLITALVVVLIPGTGVIYTVATGMTLGRRASVIAAFGCTIGILPSILASAFGLAAILHTSALAFQVLKIAGVAYLLYLAWQTLREKGPMAAPTESGRLPRRSFEIARTGVLINTLNPKLSAFFLAFLPQFVDPSAGSVAAQMATLSGVFMLMTFIIFVIYGWFDALAGRAVLGSETVLKWMRRTVAATFAGFGLRLALADR